MVFCKKKKKKKNQEYNYKKGRKDLIKKLLVITSFEIAHCVGEILITKKY